MSLPIDAPKVSAIITAYNAMQYLPAALDSVMAQTFEDFEVIIIDDGSSDHTAAWGAQLTDPRITFISQTNQGVSAARNAGIMKARGEYIALLDGDDVWVADKLEQQVQILEHQPKVGLVHTWLALTDAQGGFTGRVLKPQAEGDVWAKLIENNQVACSSAMVRRSCFGTVGLFNTHLRVAEDWDLWIRIARQYHFSIIPEALVQYRVHTNSKSKLYPEMLPDFRTIIEGAFQDAPFESLYLRSRSYGRINLCIAWKCLQSRAPNLQKAEYFCQQALLHYSPLRYSREYVRLKTAIFLMKWFGLNSYDRLLHFFNSMRRRFTLLGSS